MIVKEIQMPEYGVLEMILHSPSEELNTAYATKRPAMIICPGGAYAFCSAREADPPAIAFLNMGFQVFLLRYPVGKMAGEKRPLFALASAIKLVREYADEWQTDPNRIAVIGFQLAVILQQVLVCIGMIHCLRNIAMFRTAVYCARMR